MIAHSAKSPSALQLKFTGVVCPRGTVTFSKGADLIKSSGHCLKKNICITEMQNKYTHVIILLVDIAMMKQQNICMIMICAAIITNDDRLTLFIANL